eukprot:GHVU01057721.1.p2 GENE.GHVU01057721.1~~GHVU01057721.1.p2  ORF type:complete len:100 (+),score=9.39 GHVU01057721.1:111-410(+)
MSGNPHRWISSAFRTGTIEDGKIEHVWVMTRHDGQWVLFWEATNKKRYHMPYRWGWGLSPPPPVPSGKAMSTKPYEDESAYYYGGDYLKAWLQYGAVSE